MTNTTSTELASKTVLITGGTTGIGLATARLFASDGARVRVTGTSAGSIAAAKAELTGIAEVIASDAGDDAAIEALARDATARGGLDVLVLNAGIAKFGPLTELAAASFDDVMRTNVRGVWLALKHLGPTVKRGGAIVVTTSVNGELGMPGSSAYAASKAAARALVRVAAAEFAGAGVRVNAVSPGPIETPLHGKLGFSAAQSAAFAGALVERIPLKRFGSADEVARAIRFLATDDSSFMTGEEIVLDGGMTRV